MALTKARLLKHDLHFHGSLSARKTAKFSLNFWPVRVHEKPSFRYVPSTFLANKQNFKNRIAPLSSETLQNEVHACKARSVTKK